MSDNQETISLAARERTSLGTGAARALRREGRTPAVVYSAKSAPIHISLDVAELRAAARRSSISTSLINLQLDKKRNLRAMIKEIQRHPVRDTVVHLDFVALGKGDQVTVSVPVDFINQETCIGLKRGGMLNVVRHEVDVRCLPDIIPQSIVADLAEFDLGSSVHIEDVELPEGVTPTIDRNFTLASIASPGGGVGSEETETDTEDPEEEEE